MTARRTAGRVGCGGPLRLLETLMLQEGVGDHGHERVPMQALP